jgi:hypothetical protein
MPPFFWKGEKAGMLKSPLLNFKDLTCVPVGYTTVLIFPSDDTKSSI